MSNNTYVGFMCTSLVETLKEKHHDVFENNVVITLTLVNKENFRQDRSIMAIDLIDGLLNVFSDKSLIESLSCVEIGYKCQEEHKLLTSIDILNK